MAPSTPLRTDLLSIWTAGVDAVRAPQLMRQAVQSDAHQLTVCGESWSWADLDRIVVVGAGKAGAGMAGALEEILGPRIVDERVTGWINVPADCVRPLRRITLHPGRPAGVNEPTVEGAQGTDRILEMVASLQPQDLCLVLISGGGSALLPAPVAGISLADKQAVTRFLMSSGATINELNTVRKRLSRVKGGGLARACQQGRLISLIISDVVGDPLDIIASGPTILDTSSPQQALDILEKFHAAPPKVPQTVFDVLNQAARDWVTAPAVSDDIRNVIIGNNAVAMQAAASRAVELGYQVRSLGSDNQGEASAVGRDLAQRCIQELNYEALTQPICILSGGEPVVHLSPTTRPRKGGRNQQLVLAALIEFQQADSARTNLLLEVGDGDLSGSTWEELSVWTRIGLLSGGTDGEDGPTDAAGAYVDDQVLFEAQSRGLNPQSYLDACDAYTFFAPCNGLIKTGPTHTNVMDLRVALVN